MRTTLVLTKRCNLRCPYCHISKSDTGMSDEVLSRAVDMAMDPANPVPELHFFGGEPLLEKESLLRGAHRAVMKARALGLTTTIHVSTNCLEIDRHFVQAVADLPFSFELSIDGSRGWNDTVDTKPGRFRDAVRRATWLIDSDAECFVNLVVTPETVSCLALNFEDVLSTGATRVNISPATGLAWTPSAAEELAAGLWEIYGKHIKKGHIRLLNLEQNADEMLFNREITVDCDGTVYSGNAFLYSDGATARQLTLGHVSQGLTTHDYFARRQPLSFYVENVFPRKITLSYSNIIHVLKSFRQFATQERLQGEWNTKTIRDNPL